ncbi:MAG: DUF5683 domain-containing protein [Candidatus Krumholzibacteriota bacterium]
MILRPTATIRFLPAQCGWVVPVLFLLATVCAAGAQEVELPAVDLPDTTAIEDLQSEMPQPSAGALDVEEVDLWSTGVSPTGAVLATPLFPGWGQLYSDNSWKAALAYGAEMYFWTNILSRDRQAVRARDLANTFPVDDPNYTRYNAIAEESWEQMRDFAWWSGGVLLIIALDAYVGAHLFNFDRDPVPVPNRWEDTFGPVGESVGISDPGPTLVVFQWRKKF